MCRWVVATVVVVLAVMGSASAQECETFRECMAGMCQNGGCVGVPLNGGTCDDFQDCTINDTCVNGNCAGTLTAGGTCDDFQDCTTNDRCTDVGEGFVVCMGGGTVEPGTRCQSQCGTCQPLVPEFPEAGMICRPDVERLNAPCTPTTAEELGPCFVGRCVALGPVPVQSSFCQGNVKTCPDDGNVCTGEFCNFETGECETAPLPVQLACFPAECHRCVQETGQCVPINIGGSCDDGNVCTSSTVCTAEGSCVAGAPAATATPTRTTGGNTATPGPPTPTNTVPVNTATPTSTPGTPTSTPTQGRCVGDCNSSGTVLVNELVIGVNIALDRAPLAQCPAFDTNSNNGVQVNELVLGVNSLLRGCVAAALTQ